MNKISIITFHSDLSCRYYSRIYTININSKRQYLSYALFLGTLLDCNNDVLTF